MSVSSSTNGSSQRSHSAPLDLSSHYDPIERNAEAANTLFNQMVARYIKARTRTFDLQSEKRDVFCSKPFFYPAPRHPEAAYSPVYPPNLFLNPRLTPETDDSHSPSAPVHEVGSVPSNGASFFPIDDGDEADTSSLDSPTPIISKPCVIQVQVENPDKIPFRILFFNPPTHVATDYLVASGKTVRCLKGLSSENVAFCDWGYKKFTDNHDLKEYSGKLMRLCVTPTEVYVKILPRRSFSPELE